MLIYKLAVRGLDMAGRKKFLESMEHGLGSRVRAEP